MCIPLVSTVISAGANVYGAMQQPTGNAAADLAQGQKLQLIGGIAEGFGDLAAAMARAQALKIDAASEVASAAQRASRIRRAGALAVGESRATVAGSGVKLTSDSALEAERELIRQIEQDAGVAILNGGNRARQLEMQADYLKSAGYASLIHDTASNWRRTKPQRYYPSALLD